MARHELVRRAHVCAPRRKLRCVKHYRPSVNGSLCCSSRLLAEGAAPGSMMASPKLRSRLTVFLASKPHSMRSSTNFVRCSSRSTVKSTAACSCALVSFTVTLACVKATCLHFRVTNIQEQCLPEPAPSSRCSLSAWKGMTYFVKGEEVLPTLQPLSSVPAPAPFSRPSGGVDSNKHPTTDGPCLIYLKHGYSRVRRADTATIRPISPQQRPEPRSITATARHLATSPGRRPVAQVASARTRTLPPTARYRAWAIRGRNTHHG